MARRGRIKRTEYNHGAMSVLGLLVGEDAGSLVGWSSESLETGGGESERIDCEFASSWVLSVHAIRCGTRGLARLRIYHKFDSGRQTKTFMSPYLLY